MNALVDAALDALRDELSAVGAEKHDPWATPGYVLFGSAVLYLHGIRDDVGDVDLFVRPEYWERLSARPGWKALVPDVGDPPLLEGRVAEAAPAAHVFYAWSTRDAWVDAGRCFALAEFVGVWPCVPLCEIRRQKQAAWDAAKREPGAPQAKHVADLELIDRHLEGAQA